MKSATKALFGSLGDVNERDVKALLDALELDLHILAQLQVQRAQRLVQQKHLRMVHKRPRDGHALLLPAGERGRVAPLVALQAHQLQHLQAAGADLFFVQLLQPQAERHVLEHVQVREQRVFLEHGVDLPFVRRQARDVPARKKNIARSRLHEPSDDAERRRFPAARRPQQCDELLVMDVEGKPC